MWELIERNKRQSAGLVLIMGIVLLSTGTAMGYGIAPRPEAATIGAAVAFVLFVLITFFAFYGGGKAVLAISGAREVTHKEYPKLWNVTEEMAIAAGLPMPKLYVIDSDVPNAFATGRPPDKAVIAVTRGLVERLTRDELQGVVAHEMSHIRHHDTTYMTVVVVMLGTIVLLADLYLRMSYYGGGGRRRSGKGGGGHPVMLIIGLALAILAPLVARLLYFAISRRREYLADAGAVELTRYPDGLASALEKIALAAGTGLEAANRATAHLYIVNPLKAGETTYSRWNSTHPPIAERVAILRSIAGSASLAAYNLAYERVTHVSGKRLIRREAASLTGKRGEPIRKTPQGESAGRDRASAEEQRKQFAGMVLAGLFMTCAGCGEKISLEGRNPDDRFVECAACGQVMPFPGAGAAGALAAGALLAGNGRAAPVSPSGPPPGLPRVDGRALLGEAAPAPARTGDSAGRPQEESSEEAPPETPGESENRDGEHGDSRSKQFQDG
ncbi:MAG: M48 family metallopeptidase [Planctomycetes bacterium]|nr:M48 family metallopeptidase [Planctomycetota bacterium]